MQRDELVKELEGILRSLHQYNHGENAFLADMNGALRLFYMIRCAARVLAANGVNADMLQEMTEEMTSDKSKGALHWIHRTRFFTLQLLHFCAWSLDIEDRMSRRLEDCRDGWKQGNKTAHDIHQQIRNDCLEIFHFFVIIAQLLNECKGYDRGIQRIRDNYDRWCANSDSVFTDIRNALLGSYQLMELCIIILDQEGNYALPRQEIWEDLEKQDKACQPGPQQIANISYRMVELAQYFVLSLADGFGLQ